MDRDVLVDTMILTVSFSALFTGAGITKATEGYNNVVGFAAASFFKLLDMLVDEDPDFLDL